MKGKKISFWIGLVFLILLGASYFVNIQVDDGSNFATYDRILGIVIFHNSWILCFYVLIGLGLIFFGLRKKK